MADFEGARFVTNLQVSDLLIFELLPLVKSLPSVDRPLKGTSFSFIVHLNPIKVNVATYDTLRALHLFFNFVLRLRISSIIVIFVLVVSIPRILPVQKAIFSKFVKL